MNLYDKEKIYIQYNEDVINGRIKASKNIILACKRMSKWFDRDDIYFDYKDVDKRIKLVSKLKHSAGKCAHKPFILLPYQQWMYANIFGWKWKQSNLRVVKNALLFMARKSGKTAFAASIAVTQLLLESDGQEFDFIANSGAQARIGFEMCKNYAESIDPNKLIFQRFRDSVKLPTKKCVIDVLNSDSMTLDGRSSSTFVFDELHAAKNYDLYNVMKSSQGFQSEPLSIIITTAGFLLDGYPLFEMRKTAIEILEGKKQDDTQFIALYELDPDDDWQHDEESWIKANPSLGQTVTYEYLRDQVNMAVNQPSLEYGVKTKNFNIFCQSNETWIQSKYVDACFAPVDIEDFKGEYAYGGTDLAAVSDLAALAVLYPPNENRKVYPDKYVFKLFNYAPESVLETSVNKHLYKHWNKHGYLTITQGNCCDYDYILNDIQNINKETIFATIGTDPWNATQFQISCTNAGINIEQFSQSLGNLNRPVKTLERLILMGKVVIDINDCVRWSFNNVVPKYDNHENCGLDKPTAEAKIDPVIAMVDALGVFLNNNTLDVSIY